LRRVRNKVGRGVLLSNLTPWAASTHGRVILFVNNSSPPSSGPLSADDEHIIEYFNEIEFSDDIYVVAVDQGTSTTCS